MHLPLCSNVTLQALVLKHLGLQTGNVITESNSGHTNETIQPTEIINIHVVAKPSTKISELCFCFNKKLHSGIHFLLYKNGNSTEDIDNTSIIYNHLKSYVY